jgi:hypothetical protein
MAGELETLIAEFNEKTARAFRLPIDRLLGRAFPTAAQQADMETFCTHQSNLMDSVVAGMKIRVGGDTNRKRTYIKKILSDSTFETVTYVRPSRGFARHNRRVKQEQHK